MNVKNSSYIENIKPLLKKLLKILLEKYPYASILAEDCIAKSIRVSSTGEQIEDSQIGTTRGIVLRIHDGNGFGEYAFDEITEEKIPEILEKLQRMLPMGGKDKIPHEAENLEKCWNSEVKIDPSDFSDERIIDILKEIRENGMKESHYVVDCPVMCGYKYTHKLFLSKEKKLEQNIVWLNYFLGAYVNRDGQVKRLYHGDGGIGGVEILLNSKQIMPKLVHDTVELLDSTPIKPGEYTCICSPEVTGLIAHESFGHGVEMDMFVKERALAKEYMGKDVASELITMYDSGLQDNTGMYYFDDEGQLANKTVIIEKGVLKNGINDTLSALRLNISSTGNGRRQNFSRKAYSRMTNTWIEKGNSNLADMIAATKNGFLLEYVASGMEDPKNWGIQSIVDMAREIKDGKLTGRIYSPCIMTGYVPDLLKSVDMVSKEFSMSGGSSCGKGFKEFVTVSTGGPWIRARIRLG